MNFDHPSVLFFLFILIPAITAGIVILRGAAISFGHLWPSGSRSRVVRSFVFIQAIRLLALCVFISACIIALAKPQAGFLLVPRDVTGADFAICLDVSLSMSARDGNPEGTMSRMEAELRFLKKFLGTHESGRVSLTVMKGRSEILVPMTDDIDYVLRVLDSVGPQSITSAGTNLESGLAAAISSFPPSEPRSRFILLLSDGESTSGFPDGTVFESGARIIVVAAGSKQGAYLNKGAVNEHFSIPDLEALGNLAKRSDGMLVSPDDPEIPAKLNSASVVKSEMNIRSLVREPRYLMPVFVVAAVFSLIVIAALSLFPFGIVSREDNHA